jgi:gliding motility-associated-like protein
MPAVNNGDWYVNNVKKPAFNTITEGLGKHTIKLIYTHPTTGCVNSDSFYITVKDTPWVQINNVLSLCEGDTASLGCAVANSDGVSWSSSTGGTFTDINGEQTQYIPTAQDIQNGYCFLTVTTITGLKCPDDDTVTIIIHPNPVPKFKGDVLIGCSPHSVQFTDTTANLPAGCRYVWNFGDPESGILNTDTNPNPIHLFINKGSDTKKFDISLTITTPYGCTRSLNIKEYISVYPIPVAKFDPRPRKATIALPRIRLQNLSKNVDELTKYEWTFGDPAGGTSKEKNPTYWYTNTDTGTYIIWLKTTTQYNCIDSTFEIVYIGPEMTVFIPNAFSPDNFGPGKNNFFWVEADNYKGFEMFVFNRWGEEVFFADQRLPGWNGMYQGKPAQEDVYVYQVNIQNLDGKWYHYNGTVTLLR